MKAFKHTYWYKSGYTLTHARTCAPACIHACTLMYTVHKVHTQYTCMHEHTHTSKSKAYGSRYTAIAPQWARIGMPGTTQVLEPNPIRYPNRAITCFIKALNGKKIFSSGNQSIPYTHYVKLVSANLKMLHKFLNTKSSLLFTTNSQLEYLHLNWFLVEVLPFSPIN